MALVGDRMGVRFDIFVLPFSAQSTRVTRFSLTNLWVNYGHQLVSVDENHRAGAAQGLRVQPGFLPSWREKLGCLVYERVSMGRVSGSSTRGLFRWRVGNDETQWLIDHDVCFRRDKTFRVLGSLFFG